MSMAGSGPATPSHPNRFMFTGREYDKETGLYYYRARYYNPQIGRFLQTDPVGYGDGMNSYRYCGNNPLSATDPSGETFIFWPPCVPVPDVNQWVHDLMAWAASLGRPDYPGTWTSWVPFVRWYAWGSDAITSEIDLADVGLLEAFKAKVSEGVREFEKTVLKAAKEFARKTLLKGVDVDNTRVEGKIDFDFAPGILGYAYAFATGDPFFVLGNGSVKATADIHVERTSANTAKWTATIEYDMRDEFTDPLNPTNKPGNSELPGCTPYPITAHWNETLAGSVTVN